MSDQEHQGAGRPAPRTGWRGLAARARSGTSRAQVLGAVLIAALGFALVVQVRQNSDQGLSALRQSDLVRILDDVGDRRDRLASEQSDLQAQLGDLTSGTSGSQAAIDAARARLQALGILAGTIPAEGAGIEVFISDPGSVVRAAQLLDLVQELRDAGAEAMQIGAVRVVASTAFTDAAGGVSVDGQTLRAPYIVLAIGESQTMATALGIPGGVVASLPAGARATVAAREQVTVSALHSLRAPQYARPADSPSPGSSSG